MKTIRNILMALLRRVVFYVIAAICAGFLVAISKALIDINELLGHYPISNILLITLANGVNFSSIGFLATALFAYLLTRVVNTYHREGTGQQVIAGACLFAMYVWGWYAINDGFEVLYHTEIIHQRLLRHNPLIVYGLNSLYTILTPFLLPASSVPIFLGYSSGLHGAIVATLSMLCIGSLLGLMLRKFRVLIAHAHSQ